MSNEVINSALRQHQIAAEDWRYRPVVADLHTWAERMIVEFKLSIDVPALLIEKLRHAYGHFRPGRNGFGLRNEVAIDEDHVELNPYWRVVGTLLHELLHSWQACHGKPSARNYHNKEFRAKANGLGLVVDHRGFTEYRPGETPFMVLLKKFGVTPPDLPEVVAEYGRGSKSKLRLYQCPCGVKARIGRSVFNAQCLDCGGRFILKS